MPFMQDAGKITLLYFFRNFLFLNSVEPIYHADLILQHIPTIFNKRGYTEVISMYKYYNNAICVLNIKFIIFSES